MNANKNVQLADKQGEKKQQQLNDGANLKRNLKRKQNDEELNSLVIFQGRHQSYPDELNKLIQPMSCGLCIAQMTSMKSAKDHYESKAHDRRISAWLDKNYTDVGLQMPPIKRLHKSLGPTGPNAFHCELCDLALTSSTHARQHYNGRKHLLVVQRGTKPSGAGYYDANGKWVRTGTKAESHVLANDGRFGIGEHFPKPPAALDSNGNGTAAKTTSSTAAAGVADGRISCKLCGISVTSATQIQMHLDGMKHQKNLLKQNSQPDGIEKSVAGTQLNKHVAAAAAAAAAPSQDLSMYRTPSGSYYCKLCNKAMNHVSILQQHLQGKKHLKTLLNNRNPAVAAAGAATAKNN